MFCMHIVPLFVKVTFSIRNWTAQRRQLASTAGPDLDVQCIGENGDVPCCNCGCVAMPQAKELKDGAGGNTLHLALVAGGWQQCTYTVQPCKFHWKIEIKFWKAHAEGRLSAFNEFIHSRVVPRDKP